MSSPQSKPTKSALSAWLETSKESRIHKPRQASTRPTSQKCSRFCQPQAQTLEGSQTSSQINEAQRTQVKALVLVIIMGFLGLKPDRVSHLQNGAWMMFGVF